MNIQQSFAEIYEATYRDLLRLIIYKCGDLDDANDLLQETYIELYHALARRPVKNAKAYLIGIAKNKLKQHYGREKRRREQTVSREKNEMTFELTAAELNLAQAITDRLTADEIWRYLGQKDVLTCKIFYLYYGENLPIKEIAAGLALSQSSVKNHLYRTLKELTKLYGKETI